MTPEEGVEWLAARPEIRSVRIAAADLNGLARAKRLPAGRASRCWADGTRMPLSVLNVDVQGHDIDGSPLVFESGDRDGVLRPTERGFVPMPWLAVPAALLPASMFHDDGTPFEGDPRHALAAVLARYEARGLRPVVATEMEFYLIDDSGAEPAPPASPRSGRRRLGGEMLSLRALDAFDAFFADVYDACEAMGIPADSAISETGMGQYEVNLLHRGAMDAADDAWLFKLMLRGIARRHGFAASFMAKPYADQPGNGMHAHVSVLSRDGANVFDDGSEAGSAALRHAVAGCLAAMPASTLILAPHGGSYDRFAPGSHAPTGIAWAYENRTAAIRVPAGPPAARRLEHRVAGGDANPYLLLAAILAAALHGIDAGIDAPRPITGDAYAADLPRLPATWDAAIEAFDGPVARRLLRAELVRNYLMTKRQERGAWAEMTAEERRDLYLDTV